MQITFNRTKLNQVLYFVKHSIPTKEIEPVLNNLYFKTVSGGKVQVVSTDYDLMAIAECEATYSEEAAFTVPAAKLLSLVQKLNGEYIIFDVDETQIKITCDSYEGTFPTIDAETYPEIKTLMDTSKAATLERKMLSHALMRVQFAANKDEARKNLSAVEVSPAGFVASNGKVTSIYRQELTIEKLYISTNCLDDLIAVLEASKAENCEIYSDAAYLIFKLDNDIFFTRRCDVDFPDVFGRIDAKAIEKNTNTLSFSVKSLKSSIQRIALTASEDTKLVKFTLEAADKVRVASYDKTMSSSELIDAKFPQELLTGENKVELSFNYDYLLSILGKYASEEIEFKFAEDIRIPVSINEANWTAYVMRLLEA